MMKNNFFAILIAAFVVGCSKVPADKYIGYKYLGAKYVNEPLGEEKLPDTDPLIRFDAFDCVTFVETSLADGDLEKLTKIRYKDGNIDFVNRNHFTELDWVQNNKDIVENVSNKYGKTKFREFVVDKQSWFKKVHNLDVKTPKQSGKLEYIPYAELQDIKTDKPLVVLFVINNPNLAKKIGTDVSVAHLGFLLPDGMLRHASSQHGRVLDVDFKEYVKERMTNKNNLGIALLKIK